VTERLLFTDLLWHFPSLSLFPSDARQAFRRVRFRPCAAMAGVSPAARVPDSPPLFSLSLFLRFFRRFFPHILCCPDLERVRNIEGYFDQLVPSP